LKAAELAVATDKEASIWNWRFFKNAARVFGIIVYPGVLDQDRYERLKTQFETSYQGTDNAHKVAILEGGVSPDGRQKAEFLEVGKSQKDMDFTEQRKFSRDEIFVIFGIPKGVMIAEDVNKANSLTHKSIFIENTIVPLYRKFVSYLNEFYIKEFGDDSLFFDFEDPTLRDVEATIKFYESAIKNGWMSPNEVREAEGLLAFKGGDALYLPIAVMQIGEIKNGKKVYKLNVKMRSETTKEKVNKLVKKHVANKLKKLSKAKYSEKDKDKKKKKDAGFVFTGGFKRRYIESYVKRADAEELIFGKRLKVYFRGQEKRVVSSISVKSIKKDISIRFNIKRETELAIKAFDDVVKELVREHGEETMELLGLEAFSMTADQVEAYLKTDGLKFANAINQTTKDKLARVIARGTEAGQTIDEITIGIKGVYKEAGTSRARKIARTEVARSSNFATTEAFRQSGVVTAKEWITTPDERLCPWCAPLEGKIVQVESNFFEQGDTWQGDADKPLDIDYADVGAPPLHSNCRCTLLPVIKSKTINEEAFLQKMKLRMTKKETDIKVAKAKKEGRDEGFKKSIKLIKD